MDRLRDQLLARPRRAPDQDRDREIGDAMDLRADLGDRRALPDQAVGLADREPGRNEEVEQQDHEACHLQHGPLPDLGQGEHAAAVDRLPVQDDPRVAFVQPNLDAAGTGRKPIGRRLR